MSCQDCVFFEFDEEAHHAVCRAGPKDDCLLEQATGDDEGVSLCPRCGRDLDGHAICPVCGSAPLAKKNSGKMILLTERIVDVDVEVEFRLSDYEYIHYRFARGLITHEEARVSLGDELDYHLVESMQKLARHFGRY